MYHIKAEYFPFFVQMAQAVQQRAFTTAILYRLSKMEEEFGISASDFDKRGKTAVELANWAIQHLQDSGRLPVFLDKDEYDVPTIDITEDSMNREPDFDDSHDRVLHSEELIPKSPRARPASDPISALSAYLAANKDRLVPQDESPVTIETSEIFKSVTGSSSSTGSVSLSLAPFAKAPPTEEEAAQAEKQRNVKAAEQARLAVEREQEAQKRKAIKDQIELDKQVRIKEAEEKKRSKNEAMQLSALQSLSETTTPRSAGSSSALASPSTQRENENASSAPSALNGENSISRATASTSSHGEGKSTSSTQRSLNPYDNPDVQQATLVRGYTGHASAVGSSSTHTGSYSSSGAHRLTGNIDTMLDNVAQERNNAFMAVSVIHDHFRKDPSNINPSLEQNLADWTARAQELDRYYRYLSAVKGGAPGGFGIEPSGPTVAPGFTLREQSDRLLDEDDEAIEGRELVMVEAEATWQVRVRLPDGKLITVKLNPSHTVGDLLHHVGTFVPLSSRNRLEVSGKKVELELDWTAEKAELRSTTLVVTLK